MKRMHLIVVAGVVVLAVGGLLAVRYAARPAGSVPPVSKNKAQPPSPSMDTWQGAIKADRRTDYTPDPAAKQRLLEKLRDAELHQRPQEGRN